jgi:hypothetical protein
MANQGIGNPTAEDILSYFKSRNLDLSQPVQVDKELLEYVGMRPGMEAAGEDVSGPDLELLNFKPQGRGLPLRVGRPMKGGTPHIMPMDEYIKQVVPGEPTVGGYIKDTLSNAASSFISPFANLAENIIRPVAPGLADMARNAEIGTRSVAPPSADVRANAPIGREVTGLAGSALGTIGAFALPGGFAGKLATEAGLGVTGARVAGSLASAALGAGSQSEEMYDSVLRETGDKSKALKAYFLGGGIGATYGIDFPVLAGIDNKTRGLVSDILVHGAIAGTAGAAQTAAADAVWNTLTDKEKPVLVDAMKAFAGMSTVGGAGRGFVHSTEFGQRILQLSGGTPEQIKSDLMEPKIPHEQRVQGAIPWESVDDQAKGVVDSFKSSLLSDATSDQDRDRINRMMVVPPTTKAEQAISKAVVARGGRLVVVSHPGEALSRPAMFDPPSGTVVLDAQASDPAKLFSYAAHEQGHLLAFSNPDAFKEFFGELQTKYPKLFDDAMKRRIDAEPDQDAAWLKDPGLVRAETFSQVSQDVSGMLYTLGTDPDYVRKALTGPSKLSFANFLDTVIKGVNKLSGADLPSMQDRQLQVLKDIQVLTGGRGDLNPREAHGVAVEITNKLNGLIGQKYSSKPGLSTFDASVQELDQHVRARAEDTARKEQGAASQVPDEVEPTGKPPTLEPPNFAPPTPGQKWGMIGAHKNPGEPAVEGVPTEEAEQLPMPKGSDLKYLEPQIAEILKEKQAKAREAMGKKKPVGFEAGLQAQAADELKAQGKEPAAEAPVEPKAPPEQAAELPETKASAAPNVMEEEEPPARKAREEPLDEETEAEGEADRQASAQSALEALKGLAENNELDDEGKATALGHYVQTDEGKDRLFQVASGGMKPAVREALIGDIKDDIGFRPTPTQIRKAIRGYTAEAGEKAVEPGPAKLQVTLDPTDENFKSVSKLVDAGLNNKVVRGTMLAYRAVMRDVEAGKIDPTARAIMETMAEKSGVKKITPKQIRIAMEQIAENRERGVQFGFDKDEAVNRPGRKRKDQDPLFAAFTPYKEGDDPALGDSSEHVSAMARLLRSANETFFDDFEAVRRAIKGKVKGESGDVSLKETAYWGRVGYKQSQRIRNYYQKGVMSALADGDIDPFYDKPGKPSFDSYLLMKSDPEYSAVVKSRSGGEKERGQEVEQELSERGKSALETGKLAEEPGAVKQEKGSGISPADAARYKSEISSLTPKEQQAYDKAGNLVWQMTDEGLNWLVQEGNLSKGEADGWRKAFGPHYVPHLSIWEPDVQYTPYGDGYQATTQISERVQGRTSRPYSPLVAAFSQAMQRAAVSEKNRVGRSFGDFVRENQDSSKWQVYDGFADIPKSLVETNRVFRFIENGEKKWVGLYGKDGFKLAKALTRLNVQNAPKWLGWMRPMTRMVTNMATAWNVIFSGGNLPRDLGAAAAFGTVDLNAGFAKEVVKPSNVFDSMKTAMKAAFEKAPSDDTADFRKFQAAGGTTGMVELMSYENQKQRLGKEFQRYADSDKPAHIKKVMSDVVQSFENFNGAVEQATRYSAWKAAKARGMSDDAAAAVSKGITVNFNRRGTIAPALGAAYAFGAANLAGLSRFARAVGTKRGIALASGMAAAGFMESLYNRYNGGQDEDGTNAWDSLGDWEKARHFRIAAGEGKFYGFPLAWGWNLPFYTGVLAEHLYSGSIKPSDFAQKVALESLENMNPIGAHTIATEMTPTAFRPLTEIAENSDAFGRQIAPPRQPWELAKPNYERAFTTVSPQWAAVAKQLAMIGGTETNPGPIDLSPEWLEHVATFMVGGTARNAFKFVNGMSDLLTGNEVRAAQFPGASYFISQPNPAGRGQRFQEEVNATDEASQRMKRGEEKLGEGTGSEQELEQMAGGETGALASMRNDAMKLREGYSELRKAWQQTTSASEKKELEAAMTELQRAMREMTQSARQPSTRAR